MMKKVKDMTIPVVILLVSLIFSPYVEATQVLL